MRSKIFRTWSLPSAASGRRPSGVTSFSKPSIRPGRQGIFGPPNSYNAVSSERWRVRPRAYLNGSNACKGPEVTIANPREVLLYALQQATGDIQAVVGTVERLRGESHGSIVAVGIVLSDIRLRGISENTPATIARGFVVSSACVPSQSHENRAI
jgi:hypothetical protein